MSLGANLDNPLENIERAIHLLEERIKHTQFLTSSFYKTAPLSTIPQPDFINCVLFLQTTVELPELWEVIQAIEVEFGKTLKSKEAPRPLDIDILTYGNVEQTRGLIPPHSLILPHPRMFERAFVLEPLFELMKMRMAQSIPR